MIAAVTNSQTSWSFDHLPFNWFDIALILILTFGLFRGRKNGMSKEVLPLFQWIAIVVVCGFTYLIVTNTLVNLAGLKKKTGTFILSYLIVAALIFFIFSLIKNALKPKLGASNAFGSGEYYLGMLSGIVRYTCIVVFFLALLNAPVYTAAEIQATKEYNNRWYGGGLKGYDGNYLPSVQTVQAGVFKESIFGPYIHDYLGRVLIDTGVGGAQVLANQPVIHIGN